MGNWGFIDVAYSLTKIRTNLLYVQVGAERSRRRHPKLLLTGKVVDGTVYGHVVNAVFFVHNSK